MALFGESRRMLEAIGVPAGDPAPPPDSPLTFADGGHYKWELAGAVDAGAVAKLIERLDAEAPRIDQFTHTEGIMRLTDAEIGELVDVCAGAERQLVMAAGPRGVYDIGAQDLAPSAAAKASAYRIRGAEQLVRAVEDVRRAVDLGVRGFLCFDEGLLWSLSKLRAAGELPEGIKLKASSNMGVSNPAHAKLIADAGADSINLQRDITIPMLAASRAVTSLPFDLHTDNPMGTGGFLRLYDIPDIIRVGAPVYLKTGNAAQVVFDAPLGPKELDGIIRQIAVEAEMIARHSPDLTHSTQPES
jgi:hypothetical protein